MHPLIFLDKVVNKCFYLLHLFKMSIEKRKLGYCGANVTVHWPNTLSRHIFLYDHVNLYEGAKFIISGEGKFIMKANSGAAQGLTVITGRHGVKVGTWFKETMLSRERDVESTVTVCEDARIGANVTLLMGVTVNRGAQVGACSVVTHDVPPYAVVAGNPARVVRFIFSPEQILEHEAALYPPEERLSLARLKEIQSL